MFSDFNAERCCDGAALARPCNLCLPDNAQAAGVVELRSSFARVFHPQRQFARCAL
jgi:hypothetical protein